MGEPFVDAFLRVASPIPKLHTLVSDESHLFRDACSIFPRVCGEIATGLPFIYRWLGIFVVRR